MSNQSPEYTPVDNTETVDVVAEVVTEKNTSNGRIKSSFEQLINAIKEEKILPLFKHLSTRLQSEWSNLDSKWTNQHGERYQTIKQKLKTINTRYVEEKNKAQTEGTTPIDQKQQEWETKASQWAVSVAQKEQQIKKSLVELLQKK